MASKQLTVEVKVGDSVSVDHGRVVITVEEKSGQRARLRFVADSEVAIEAVRARPTEAATQIS